MTDAKIPAVPTLTEGIRAAQRAMQPVSHDAQNPHHGYAYTSAEAIIEHGRAALIKAGVTFYRHSFEIIGGADAPVVRSFFHVSVPTDERLETRNDVPIVTHTGQTPDKAEFAALTTGLAYALRDLLLIVRPGATDDISGRDDTKTTTSPPRTAKSPGQGQGQGYPEDNPDLRPLGKVDKEYWDAKRKQDEEALQALRPHPLAVTRKGKDGAWRWWLHKGDQGPVVTTPADPDGPVDPDSIPF